MIRSITIALLIMARLTANGQEKALSPENNPVDMRLVNEDVSVMTWYLFNDTARIDLGKVKTEIKTDREKIYIVTTVNMNQISTKWIDSTVVDLQNFKPLYHSSYNQQRDMVLHFSSKVSGYYLDKITGTRTDISENVDKSFFDSNFYPQLLRWLPLEEGYINTISIFDYNPNGEIGILTATLLSTEEITIDFNGNLRKVWKVMTTDEISENNSVSSYYIDKETRRILKQEIDMDGRKMVMEINALH